MRRLLRIVGLPLVIGFLVLILSSPALAGDHGSGIWKGIAIGLGTGIALGALSHPAAVYYYQPPPPPVILYEFNEPAPPPVVYAYPPVRAIALLGTPHYYVDGPPYGKAHGHWKRYWKRAHRWHDDD